MVHITATKYQEGLAIKNYRPAAGGQNVIMPEVMLAELRASLSVERRIIFKATAWTG